MNRPPSRDTKLVRIKKPDFAGGPLSQKERHRTMPAPVTRADLLHAHESAPDGRGPGGDGKVERVFT